MPSERDRALKLLEQEDKRNEQRTEREQEQEREGRLQDAIRRVKAQDVEVAAERARMEARQLADELGLRRAELEDQADAALDSLLGILADLRLLDEEQRTHLRYADEHYISDGYTKRSRYAPLDAYLKTWVRGKLRELAFTDERECLMLRMHGFPEARHLAEIDPLARTEPGDQAG